ncbi:3,4-dihydroxy-2-butanone 4-phosphate synthase [Phlyctema vagabunda]|uniref:3,4-dihydroxy-2-butanone 4-phosphate synthase n=1 Tax=Phlyctema vagabunda TaxID=108571 RepID=A0ABR4P8P1_9HELO
MPASEITREAKEVANKFDSIEDSIEAFRNGEFIIVLDDLSRENEGDLIIAASDVTTEQMAFMIRYSSGYVCTPTTPAILEKLGLPQMVTDNEDPKGTAYSITIDASSDLTTTGISAHDRALTCRTLANATSTKDSFRRPGHVLPLRARAGGVRERGGHTEAGVEFCRLAGKPLVAAICEMVEDGDEVAGQALRREPGMMRRDGCLAFGKKWGLKVCTIEDLVKYVEVREGPLKHTNGTH